MPDRTPTHDHGTDLVQLLALDAHLHASAIEEALEVTARHTAGMNVATIVDVGAGTGAGTFALAEQYAAAQVLAVDVAEDMLATVRHRAAEHPTGERIRALRADIGDEDFDVGVADLIWSSNALHEVSDPAMAFANLSRSLRSGGILVVLEMDSPPLVLPEEHEHLEHALRTAAGADGSGPDWSASITAAGLDLVDTRSLTSDQRLPADGPGGAYATLELRRLLHHARPALSDRAATDLSDLVADLAGPHQRLDHVRIRGSRTLWAARR